MKGGPNDRFAAPFWARHRLPCVFRPIAFRPQRSSRSGAPPTLWIERCVQRWFVDSAQCPVIRPPAPNWPAQCAKALADPAPVSLWSGYYPSFWYIFSEDHDMKTKSVYTILHTSSVLAFLTKNISNLQETCCPLWAEGLQAHLIRQAMREVHK